MGRIRLFPLLFQNGCYQSSRFKGNEDFGNETVLEIEEKKIILESKLFHL